MIFFIYTKKISPVLYDVYFLTEKILPFLAIGIIILKKKFLDKNVRKILIISGILLLWGSIVSIVNLKPLAAIFYQYYHELKFPLTIILASIATVKSRILNERNIIIFITTIATFSTIDIIFRIISSGAYDNLYSNGGHFGHGDFGEIGILRHSGIFWHSSQLAFFSCISLIYLSKNIDNRNYYIRRIAILLSIFCLFETKQNFEIISIMLVAILIIFNRYGFISNKIIKATAYVSILLCIVILPFIFQLLGLNLLQINDAPRFVFFQKAYEIFSNSNFMGAGWGTIGSHAAADITHAYNDIYWQGYWWIKEGLYSYDTYWPHVIGELGTFGILIVTVLMVTTLDLFKSTESKLIILYLIFTSLSTSNVQSFFYLVTCLVFVSSIESEFRKS